MQRRTQYVVAALAGLLAGGLAYLGAITAVDANLAWFAAVIAAPTWAIATGATLRGVELDVTGQTPRDDLATGAKIGTLVGGFVSMGVAGTMGLVTSVSSLQLGLVVALIALGYGLGCLSLGQVAATLHVDGGPTAGTASQGAPADD